MEIPNRLRPVRVSEKIIDIRETKKAFEKGEHSDANTDADADADANANANATPVTGHGPASTVSITEEEDGIAFAAEAAANAVEEADAEQQRLDQSLLRCRICGQGKAHGRPMLRFLPMGHSLVPVQMPPAVATFAETVVLHIFCGKTASILPAVNQPDLEILTKAGLKNKHGIGAEVNAALARTRCAVVLSSQEQASASTDADALGTKLAAKDKQYYLVREFQAHLAAIRCMHARVPSRSTEMSMSTRPPMTDGIASHDTVRSNQPLVGQVAGVPESAFSPPTATSGTSIGRAMTAVSSPAFGIHPKTSMRSSAYNSLNQSSSSLLSRAAMNELLHHSVTSSATTIPLRHPEPTQIPGQVLTMTASIGMFPLTEPATKTKIVHIPVLTPPHQGSLHLATLQCTTTPLQGGSLLAPRPPVRSGQMQTFVAPLVGAAPLQRLRPTYLNPATPIPGQGGAEPGLQYPAFCISTKPMATSSRQQRAQDKQHNILARSSAGRTVVKGTKSRQGDRIAVLTGASVAEPGIFVPQGSIQCGCGGTHLPTDTPKGTTNWRDHKLTKRHKKWTESKAKKQGQTKP